jgi:hypothetical protein
LLFQISYQNQYQVTEPIEDSSFHKDHVTNNLFTPPDNILSSSIQSASLVADPITLQQYYSTAPQLQQYQQQLQQQASMLDYYYNPTYLVSQSNNLYSQHQQNRVRLGNEQTDGVLFNTLEYQRPEASVASLGI